MRHTRSEIRRRTVDKKLTDGAPRAVENAGIASAELKAIVEALIFASPEPLTPKQMFKLLDSEPKEDVLAAIAELKRDYDRPGRLQLVEVARGLQVGTPPDLHGLRR